MISAIENLRYKMIEIANEKGSFIAPEVLAISQQLDLLLVEEQRIRHASILYSTRGIQTISQSFVACSKKLLLIWRRAAEFTTMNINSKGRYDCVRRNRSYSFKSSSS